MNTIRSLYRGHKRLKRLIDFALREGWEVVRTMDGHLKFIKQDLPPIYTSATAGDHRADRDAIVHVRPTDRGPAVNPEGGRRR